MCVITVFSLFSNTLSWTQLFYTLILSSDTNFETEKIRATFWYHQASLAVQIQHLFAFLFLWMHAYKLNREKDVHLFILVETLLFLQNHKGSNAHSCCVCVIIATLLIMMTVCIHARRRNIFLLAFASTWIFYEIVCHAIS